MLGGAGFEAVDQLPESTPELEAAGALETEAHPADAETEAHPGFCEGLFSCPSGALTVDEETLGAGANLIPAAFANLRISFSSRFRSFSLRLSASSLPPIFMGWFAFMSFMRALW